MVFNFEDKAVIKNDYLEKGWGPYRIWKEHPSKGWSKGSVIRLINRFENTESMDRKKGSGRPKTATTEENADATEELICSQEEQPGTHVAPRGIKRRLGISRSSVKRVIKNRGINQFKRMKTPRLTDGARNRRLQRAAGLIEKFEKNKRMIEKCVWQDEKDFTLEVPVNSQNDRVYYKGKKADVPDANLISQTKKQSKKVMVSAGLSWQGVTKPFFVNNQGLKVNAVRYEKHLRTQLFPAIDNLVKRDDWIFIQDGASSHTSNLVQEFLEETLKKRFVRKQEWPPSSPDCNPLDYYFWDAIKTKVYEGRFNRPFANEEELKHRIRQVWNICATNVKDVRKSMKQFVPRLQAVTVKKGSSIKTMFG